MPTNIYLSVPCTKTAPYFPPQTAIDIKNYVHDYCTVNDNISEGELRDILSDIMDEEFDTIFEDNSVDDISMCLVRQLHRCMRGHTNEVRAEFAHLPPVINWLQPGFKVVNHRADDSDSDSDSEDDDEDMENDEADAAAVPNRGGRNQPGPVSQMDEDGWTTVGTRRRQ